MFPHCHRDAAGSFIHFVAVEDLEGGIRQYLTCLACCPAVARLSGAREKNPDLATVGSSLARWLRNSAIFF